MKIQIDVDKGHLEQLDEIHTSMIILGSRGEPMESLGDILDQIKEAFNKQI